jgi:hypothetical protein
MTSVQRFYANAKSKLGKESDLPSYFVYHLTVELKRSAASAAEVRRCYEECDLHPPSWLASHFSKGLRSKPRRFLRRDHGYRLEESLREQIAELLKNGSAASEAVNGEEDELAGIEYVGVAGGSQDCQEAIEMLLQYGVRILRAQILTHDHHHCILLTDEVGDPIAVKSGFASGYEGQGPRTFSYVLQLLKSHGAEIEENAVDESIIERVDLSALTLWDVKQIKESRPVRPARWHSYINETDYQRKRDGTLWRDFPPVVPFAIIDERIVDLAISFWEAPDDRLLKGYRRLEDLVRERTKSSEHRAKLFSQAFIGSSPKLTWEAIDDTEKNGRGSLFTAAYMAHRNPRAHRELKTNQDAQLSEFLLLNHLFRLEKESQ